jgi:formylglycine-generating enzyme required for sulfatase activity
MKLEYRALLGLALLLAAAHGHAAGPPRPGTSFKDCASCPDMVVVPAGTFMMGSDVKNEMKDGSRSEGPIRQITIAKPFALAKYEVTYAEFAAFVAATDHHPSNFCGTSNGTDVPLTFRGPINGLEPDPRQPVTCVSWEDGVAYAAWLSGKTGKKYRLPTEAEWEYAARANSKTQWPWGEDEAQGCQYENLFDLDGKANPNPPDGKPLNYAPVDCKDGYAMLAPVGRFKPNAFGLHDMLGNAWEWVQDCAIIPYPAQPTDGSAVERTDGVCEKRAVRGASWYTRMDRHRPSFRGADPENTASHQFGFRLARTL